VFFRIEIVTHALSHLGAHRVLRKGANRLTGKIVTIGEWVIFFSLVIERAGVDALTLSI